jgi:ARG/rhodanese/phosphatase superfamily protein
MPGRFSSPTLDPSKQEIRMKAQIRVLTCVVLCSLSLACSSAGKIVEAKSESPGIRRAIKALVAATPARPEWRLGAPVTHNNLTVFPVLADETHSTQEFITLDEGLRSGKVKVTEIGADGRSQTIRPNQRSSDNAEVNRLMVTNTSGKTLVLIAGEIVIGGKQDRIVGHDCLVSSSNKPVPIDVFCVEHGRWQAGSAVGQSRGAAQGGATETAGHFESASSIIALPLVREKAQATKDQSQVWSEVAKAERANGISSSTGTLNKVYNDKQVNAKLEAYDKALGPRLVGRNIVGAVVAIGGEIVSADVFANSALFQAYWPKLLKSYALQAVSSGKSGSQRADRASAEAFLSRADAASSSAGKDGVYKLSERNAAADASFELESDATTRRLIHFNRVNKK